MSKLFDPVLFGAELFQIRTRDRREILSLRDAAKFIGVSHATLSRVERGYPPTVENYLRIKLFIDGPPGPPDWTEVDHLEEACLPPREVGDCDNV